MSVLNFNSAISEELFDKVIKCIDKFCKKALKPNNTKMVLTEGDLQAWIFHHLVCDLRKESGWGYKTDGKQIGIHCNPSFLNTDDKLRNIPDVVILDKQEYSVESTGDLYPRKGYTLWGSSIMLELKLFRTIHSETEKLEEWKQDINKLVRLRANLYPPNNPEKFFPAFVLLAKKNISTPKFDEIEQYATDNNVKPLLFYPGNSI
jgi:hypothetical protein